MTDKEYRLEKARKLKRMLDDFPVKAGIRDNLDVKQQVMNIFRVFASVHNLGLTHNIAALGNNNKITFIFLGYPYDFEYRFDPFEKMNTCKCTFYEVVIDFDTWEQSLDTFYTVFARVEKQFYLNPWNDSFLVKDFNVLEREKEPKSIYIAPGTRASDVFAKLCDEYGLKSNAYIVPSRHCGMRATLAFIDEMHTLSTGKAYMVPKGWRVPEIKDVKFEDPATIVFWGDGTKTVVRAQGEEYDPEKGLAMAISRKALGNEYGYYNTFKHWLKKWKKKSPSVKQVEGAGKGSLEGIKQGLEKVDKICSNLSINTAVPEKKEEKKLVAGTCKTCAYNAMPATALPCSECVNHKYYIMKPYTDGTENGDKSCR